MFSTECYQPKTIFWIFKVASGLHLNFLSVLCVQTADKYNYRWSYCCINIKWLMRLQKHLSIKKNWRWCGRLLILWFVSNWINMQQTIQLIRVMRRHDLANKKAMAMTKKKRSREHFQRVTLETCDPCNLWPLVKIDDISVNWEQQTEEKKQSRR